MTRAEVVAAVEAQLGRPLRAEELAYVDSRVEGETIQNRHIPLLVADISSGRYEALTDPPQPDPVPGDPQPLEGVAEGDDVFATRQREQGAGTGEFLPGGITQDLIDRAYDAAEATGRSPEEVDAWVTQAEDYLTQIRESGLAPPPGTPDSLPSMLEQQVGMWEEEAQALRGSPIGVPEGFVAQRQGRPNQGAGTLGGEFVGGQDFEVQPRYFEGDQFSPAGLSPEEVVKLQARLEKAALLTEGEYYAGVWDQATANAYATVLAQANRSGSRADGALTDMINNIPESVKEQRNAAKLAKQFQAPAFLKPDPAALAQDAKSYMRQKLGREPTEEEMRELTNALSSAYRQDYESQVAAGRAEFEAQEAGLETGEPVSPGAVQGVDPVARFQEVFDRRFGPEMDFREGQAETAENMSNVFNSLRTMTGLVG